LLRGLLAAALAGLVSATLAADIGATARDIERRFRDGEQRLALQQLDQALVERPADPGLRFLKAVLLTETGRSAEAVPVLERLTEDFPDLPEPYNNLAVLQAGNGRLDRARSLLETALQLDPAYRTAHENLGDVLVRLALRAYESAAVGGRTEPSLQTKLRLVRELATAR
jgi:Flp pilus assembly protein TadD